MTRPEYRTPRTVQNHAEATRRAAGLALFLGFLVLIGLGGRAGVASDPGAGQEDAAAGPACDDQDADGGADGAAEAPLKTRLLFGELDAIKQEMTTRDWRAQDALAAVLAGVIVTALAWLFLSRPGGYKLAARLFGFDRHDWQRFDPLAVLESRGVRSGRDRARRPSGCEPAGPVAGGGAGE